MKSSRNHAESPQRTPADQALFERAQASARRSIIADDLRVSSQVECQACGLNWQALHTTACPNLPCPRCESHDSLRFPVQGES